VADRKRPVASCVAAFAAGEKLRARYGGERCGNPSADVVRRRSGAGRVFAAHARW
jgi:hypothetical protein